MFAPPESAPQLPGSAPRAAGQRKDHHAKLFKTPKETLRAIHAAGVGKSNTRFDRQLMLGFLAGAYIAFGAAFSESIAAGLPQQLTFSQTVVLQNGTLEKVPVTVDMKMPGLVKFATAITFPVGLVLVVVAGAELFTGNVMYISVPFLTGSVKWWRALANLVIVYFSNFAGALFIAGALIYGAGLFDDDPWLTFCRSLAVTKTLKYGWGELLLRGIGCNWLVCLSLYLSIASEDISGKIIAIWAGVSTFVAVGFEHSVANMFFIPVGIFYNARHNLLHTPPSNTGGELNFGTFLWRNLLPVTIGNIIGSVLFVALFYSWIYTYETPGSVAKGQPLDQAADRLRGRLQRLLQRKTPSTTAQSSAMSMVNERKPLSRPNLHAQNDGTADVELGEPASRPQSAGAAAISPNDSNSTF